MAASPQVIETHKIEYLFNTLHEFSRTPERDKCLLGFFVGTPCSTLEINSLQLKDILHKSGQINTAFELSGIYSHSNKSRTIYLTSSRLTKLIEDYINYRVKKNIGVGSKHHEYRGLDPDKAFFISYQGYGYSLCKRQLKNGSMAYTCDALNRHIKMILSKAGIKGPSILSGNITFAVSLYRQGYDIKYIHQLLGNQTLDTTLKFLTSEDVCLRSIASKAFE